MASCGTFSYKEGSMSSCEVKRVQFSTSVELLLAVQLKILTVVVETQDMFAKTI